ncbi:MAG: hypothetical protein U0271_33765 [Polyangiaceae bacterium]
MAASNEKQNGDGASSIWLYAFGYFAAYAPYTALTKSLTSGQLRGLPTLSGMQILPLSTFASLLGMMVFLSAKRWWGFATHHQLLGKSLPGPTKLTFLSGLATAAIIATTTLSYTLKGTSILIMMLFMRGGVLVIAPIVDVLSKREVRWQAWVALALSATALGIGAGGGAFTIEPLGAVVILLYLLGYFVRLRLMSRQAKSADPSQSRRFFVEEQMVATPAIVLFLVVMAAIGATPEMLEVRRGFFDLGGSSGALVVFAIGVLSQGTGIFGALVLLDGRENAFCVPVNRASSVLAGVVASATLWLLLHGKPIPARELAGAALLVGAIVLLAVSGKSKGASAPAAPQPAR